MRAPMRRGIPRAQSESTDCRRPLRCCAGSSSRRRRMRTGSSAAGPRPHDSSSTSSRLMDRDRKSPGLKALQGLIWQDGYKSGELRGRSIPMSCRHSSDGARAASTSTSTRRAACWRSSCCSDRPDAGDLTKFLKGYFDTAVGPRHRPTVTTPSRRASTSRRRRCCSSRMSSRSSTRRGRAACGPRSASAALVLGRQDRCPTRSFEPSEDRGLTTKSPG